MTTRIAVLGTAANETNVALVAAWRRAGLGCELIAAADAARPDLDVVLGRLDVLPTLDGVEHGLVSLLRLEVGGRRVLNRGRALLNAHDKLRTAAVLRAAGLPHPPTALLRSGDPPPRAPVVLKPRFGSWGRDVRRCETADEVADCLAELAERRWFRVHGVLAQALLPSAGVDLRVLVAGGRAIGAVERRAAPGEWRTNVSVGGTKRTVVPDPSARDLAVAAAAAIGADLVGVDLMPGEKGYAVVEVNGAAEFDGVYRADGAVYEAAAAALGLTGARRTTRSRRPARTARTAR